MADHPLKLSLNIFSLELLQAVNDCLEHLDEATKKKVTSAEIWFDLKPRRETVSNWLGVLTAIDASTANCLNWSNQQHLQQLQRLFTTLGRFPSIVEFILLDRGFLNRRRNHTETLQTTPVGIYTTLLGNLRHLQTLHVPFYHTELEGLRTLMVQSASLHTLLIENLEDHLCVLKHFQYLFQGLLDNPNSKLKSLHILHPHCGVHDWDNDWTCSPNEIQPFLQVLRTNTTLTALTVPVTLERLDPAEDLDCIGAIGEALQANQTLEKIKLYMWDRALTADEVPGSTAAIVTRVLEEFVWTTGVSRYVSRLYATLLDDCGMLDFTVKLNVGNSEESTIVDKIQAMINTTTGHFYPPMLEQQKLTCVFVFLQQNLDHFFAI